MSSELAAVRVLVVGGVLNVVLSFVLGWVLSALRLRKPIEPLRWLMVAHEVALQEGVLLIALGFALQFARLPPEWATAGAWLLVAGSVFQDASGIINYLLKTTDQFAERSKGWVAATVNALLNTAGLGIVAVGVLRAL